jgi:hypothetical protein
MSWGATIAIGFLTGLVGAASAGYLVYLCIAWYRLRSHDGGDLGYFIIFIPLGLLSGFVLAIVIARKIASFWPALGVSLGVVAGICVVIGLVARMYGEVAPELNGDTLMLQVELKFPRGWQPDVETRRAEARSCQLQPIGPGFRAGPSIQGNVDWKRAAEIDGQWVVPCEVSLFSSRSDRLVSMNLGKTWIEFNLRLPANPGVENQKWSNWISEGFSYETGKPPVTDYAYRCRVKREGEIRDEAAAAANAFMESRDNTAAAITPTDPMTRWLPLFEDPNGAPAEYRWGGQDRMERKAVTARVLELAPLIASNDRTVMRQAVFTLGSLSTTPEPLIEPLLVAGHLNVELIREAQESARKLAAKDPATEERARQYFDMWIRSVNNAGPAALPRFRTVLEEIEREASASTNADFYGVAAKARELLATLSSPNTAR